MKKNGYSAIDVLFVVVVLGVFTIVILSTTSYAYKDKSQDYYNQTKHIIEKQAVLYGSTLKNLKDEGNIVITLSDMIDNGYYAADDSSGNVVDPRNSKATLNGLKIKLTYEDDEISAKVIDDD